MTVAILCIMCAIFLIGLYAIYLWYKANKAWLESKQISLKLLMDNASKTEQTIMNHQKSVKVMFDGHQKLINELYERVKVLEQKSNNRARKPRQK